MPLIINAPITDQTSQDHDLHVTVSNGLMRPIDNVTSETVAPAKPIEHPFYHHLYVFGFYVSILTAAVLIIAGIMRLWQQFSSGRDKARLNQLNDRIVAQDARRAQMAIVKTDVKEQAHPASEKVTPKSSGKRAAPRATVKAAATKTSTAKTTKASSAKTQPKSTTRKNAESSSTLTTANASSKGKSARVRTRAKKPAAAKAPPIVADTTPAPKPARRPSRAKPASA